MTMLAFLAVVIAGSGGPVAGDGYFVSPDLPGFETAYQAGNADAAISEQIPEGESVERWTRMVTTQRFTGLARQTSASGYAEAVRGGLARGCPGARVTPIVNLRIDGRLAARFRADCPRNPQTGLPEVFWFIAVPGPEDMHVKQVAFRRVPGAADAAWAEQFIAALRWCERGSTVPECRI
jgi:hypothetical protein